MAGPSSSGDQKLRLALSALLGLLAAMSDLSSPYQNHILAPTHGPTSHPASTRPLLQRGAQCPELGMPQGPRLLCSWLQGGMGLGCQGLPWETPMGSPHCTQVAPGPGRALTVLSHSAAPLLVLLLLPSPLLAISDYFSLVPSIILPGSIK